jgi:hypothetical protein
MYLQTTIAVAGLLAGWMGGLTSHARYATGWRDPSAGCLAGRDGARGARLFAGRSNPDSDRR